MAGGEVTHLHWADYFVTVVCLLIALGIGVFFALFKGGQKTKEEYLVGSRRMGLGPVCLSLFVTFQSAISLIGTPSDNYNTGTMVFFIFLGISVAYVVAYYTIVPLVYPLRLTSVYHYLQLRFRSHRLRILITSIGMLQASLYMGIALYTPALVLQSVAGLSLWVSLVLVGVVGTVYTAIGGIKSVVWTDVFQTVIVFTGILSVLIKGLIQVGGFSRMVDIAEQGGRLIFDEVDPKARHSVWSTIIGACFMWMISLFNQSSVQRICSLPSLRDARRCFILNIPLNLLYGATLSFKGVLLYTYFVTIGCDPYAAGYISNKNQVAPYFVLHVLRELPGMTGLYMSMLFSGALSTLSSGTNSLAANTVEDVLATPLKRVKDTTVTVIAKLVVVGFGCLSLGLAYLMKNLSGPVTQLSNSIVGAFGSPVLGVFFLAAGFPRCNIYGAGVGVVVGSAVSVTVAVGSTLYGAPTPSLPPGPVNDCGLSNTSWTAFPVSTVSPVTPVSAVTPVSYVSPVSYVYPVSYVTSGDWAFNSTAAVHVYRSSDFTMWDISYLWFSVIGCGATIISGMIISLLTGCGKDQEDVDPRLIFPFCRKLYGLPEPEGKSEKLRVLPLKNDWSGASREGNDIDDVEMSSFIATAADQPSVRYKYAPLSFPELVKK